MPFRFARAQHGDRAVDERARKGTEGVGDGDGEEDGGPAVVLGEEAEEGRGGDEADAGDGVVEGEDGGGGAAADIGDDAPAGGQAPVAEEFDGEEQPAEDIRIVVPGQGDDRARRGQALADDGDAAPRPAAIAGSGDAAQSLRMPPTTPAIAPPRSGSAE